jgi:hypothetical protein
VCRRRRDHRPPVPPLPYDWHETYLPGVDGHHPREERRPRRAATRAGLSPVRRQSCRTTRFPNGCIAAGGYHSAVVDEEGQVWTFGLGKLGQLGHGPGMRLLNSQTKEMTHDEYHPRSINGFFPDYRGIQVCATLNPQTTATARCGKHSDVCLAPLACVCPHQAQ